MHNNSNDISYLLKNKKYKKAQLVLKKELKKSPSNPTTLRLMGVVVLHMNQLNLAEKFLLKSYKLDSSSVPTLLNIASLYKLIPDYEKAIHWIKKAVALEPTSLPALYNYANILKANAQYTDAEKLYFAVLKVDERHYGALLNLGHIYKNSGKISLAADYYHKLLAINPSDTNVYLALSNLKKYKFSKDEEYMIDKLLKDPIPVINKIPLYFCKTKILEDQNKYPESFNFLQKGNELKYKNIKRKPVNWTKYTEDIKKVFNSDFIKNSTTIDISDQSPIFIVSMPRAGSTLIEQILASHTDVNGAAELPYMPYLINKQSKKKDYPFSFNNTNNQTFTQIGHDYLNMSKRWRLSTKHFTDKLPNNLSYLGVILLSIPNSKVIFSVRNPMDVTLSCYRQLFAKGNEFSFDLKELAAYHHHHKKIMEYWQELFPNKILKIKYEDLVTNTKFNVENILKFCNLPWQDKCLEFHKTKRIIRTASAGQVTEKINTKAINRYQRYNSKLDTLKEYIYIEKPLNNS